MLPVWVDVLKVTAAFWLFPFILIIPGYVIGMSTNVLSFNSGSDRLPKSLILSIAICPWMTFVLYRFTDLTGVSLFYAAALIAALYFAFSEKDKLLPYIRQHLNVGRLLFLIGFFLALTLLLIDFQQGENLLRPLMTHDYTEHVAATNAVSRTGVPPVNPHFFPGQPLPFFFYYFWFMLCSLIDTFGGLWIGPRDAMLASILWGIAALIALVHLYIKTLGPRLIPDIDPKYYILGLFLLPVAGLDLIPILMKGAVHLSLGNTFVPIDLFWWNDQVPTWYATALWSPHHIAGFVAAMTALLIVIEHQSRFRVSIVLLLAISLASTVGLSVWVALVAATFLLVWFVITWLKGWKTETSLLFCSGVGAIALALPYIIDLHAANNLDIMPVRFHVRPFANMDVLLEGIHPVWLHLLSLLLLPANYFVELGFFAIGAIVYWQYRKNRAESLHRAELFMLVMFVVSLTVCTFFRSQIANNDLGWRGLMFAQLVLLIYSLPLLVNLIGRYTKLEVPKGVMGLAKAALVCGSLLIFFELYVSRFHPVGPGKEGGAALRDAYEWMNENFSEDVVIQHNPNTYIDYYSALYGHRQVAVSDQLYGWLYGINPSMYDSTYQTVSSLFDADVDSTESSLSVALKLGIDAIVVKETDPIWADSTHWLNALPVLYSNEWCRVHAMTQDALLTENR